MEINEINGIKHYSESILTNGQKRDILLLKKIR